jgi:hypothetical protein
MGKKEHIIRMLAFWITAIAVIVAVAKPAFAMEEYSVDVTRFGDSTSYTKGYLFDSADEADVFLLESIKPEVGQDHDFLQLSIYDRATLNHVAGLLKDAGISYKLLYDMDYGEWPDVWLCYCGEPGNESPHVEFIIGQ